jgi:hypothetical protein
MRRNSSYENLRRKGRQRIRSRMIEDKAWEALSVISGFKESSANNHKAIELVSRKPWENGT